MWTLWTLETSMASSWHAVCVLRALVSRKGSGATGVRQAGFTRTVCSKQSAAATPLSVSAAISALRGPEALRHRLSTVLPLVRRCAVCAPARNVTYRATPHRRRADSGMGIRVEDDGKKLEGQKRDTRHAFAIIPAA